MKQSHSRFLVPVSFIVAFLIAACTFVSGEVEQTEVGETEIWIEDGGHCTPFHKYVEPGATVTWINKDTIAHAISSGTPDDPGRWFESDTIPPGDTYSKKFEQAETYPYHCLIHGYHSDQLPVLIITDPIQPTP